MSVNMSLGVHLEIREKGMVSVCGITFLQEDPGWHIIRDKDKMWEICESE